MFDIMLKRTNVRKWRFCMRSLDKNLGGYRKHILYLGIVTIVLVIIGVIASNCFTSISQASDLEAEGYKYYKCYTIQSGDTMWSIATEHRTLEYDSIDSYLEEVYVINKIGDSKSIIAGHTLILPYYSEVEH